MGGLAFGIWHGVPLEILGTKRMVGSAEFEPTTNSLLSRNATLSVALESKPGATGCLQVSEKIKSKKGRFCKEKGEVL